MEENTTALNAQQEPIGKPAPGGVLFRKHLFQPRIAGEGVLQRESRLALDQRQHVFHKRVGFDLRTESRFA